ncbi:condensation domain-containing protein [Enterococcus sp. LJL98]
MLCSVSEKEKKIIASCLANETAYNIPLFIKFNKGMNIKRMTEILTELLQQHKIFQTAFQINERSLEKKIGGIPNIAVEEMTARDKEHIYQRNLISIQDPQLMKIILCKIKDRSYDYLFMNIHHVLVDGFSTNLFLKEIISRYTSNTSLGMISEKKIGVECEADRTKNEFSFNGYDRFKAQLQTKKVSDGQQVSLHKKLNLAGKKHSNYSDFSNNLSAFSLSVAEWLGLEQAYLAYPSLGRNRNNYRSLGNFVELVPFQYKFDRKSNETKKMLIQNIQERVIKNAADNDFFETMKRNNGTGSLDIFNSIVFDYKSTSLIDKTLDEDQQIILEEEEAYIDQKFDLHFVIYRSEKELELTVLSNEFPQTELEELTTIFEQKLQKIYSDKDVTVQELLAESQEIIRIEQNEERSITGDMIVTLKEMILSLIDEEELDEAESFFDLGIDSLLLVKLKKKIKQTFAVTLKISDFFNNYTVYLLAEKITTKRMEENYI